MSPREPYAYFRDEFANGKEHLQAARQGFWKTGEWQAAQRKAVAEHLDITTLRGPRYRQAGVEGRRLEATRRVLDARVRGEDLSYQRAMSQVNGEWMRKVGKGIFAKQPV